MLGISSVTYSVVYGVSHLPVSRSAVILLFEVIVVTIAYWLVEDDPLLPRDLVGGSFVIVAAYLAAHSATDTLKKEIREDG